MIIKKLQWKFCEIFVKNISGNIWVFLGDRLVVFVLKHILRVYIYAYEYAFGNIVVPDAF